MTYKVHLFPTVRVTVKVEASSQEDAVKLAEERFVENQKQLLLGAEWDEGPIAEALVDVEGDRDYQRSQWYRVDDNGNPKRKE